MPREPRRRKKEDSPGRYFSLEAVCEEMELTRQTLRGYERRGLIRIKWIQTADGEERGVFPPREVKRLRRVCLLKTQLGVNLAGVEVILRLLDRLEDAE